VASGCTPNAQRAAGADDHRSSAIAEVVQRWKVASRGREDWEDLLRSSPAETLIAGWRAGVAEAEELCPWVGATEGTSAVARCQAAAHGMTLVPLHAAFTLLKLNRVAGTFQWTIAWQ
jgi:hypothetical protein